jgi:hypothetical protein
MNISGKIWMNLRVNCTKKELTFDELFDLLLADKDSNPE